ncbi:MAG: GHKL domain-containing protein, partial [Comamonas sp.]|nr:GHKL domain-containing protein [Comamonas sp.]
QDLFEMLGNLLDNAGKWAHRQVSVTLAPATAPGMLLITVDDDGPGIADAAQRQQIFQRGERLDENRPGAGLGLNIVQVLAQTYGGDVRAEPSALGGLQLQLQLPLSTTTAAAAA